MLRFISAILFILFEGIDPFRSPGENIGEIIFIFVLLESGILMQNLIILMSFFYQIVTIGSKQTIYFLLDKEEIFPAEDLFHNSLHQVNQRFKENLIFVVGTVPLFSKACRIETDDDCRVVITLSYPYCTTYLYSFAKLYFYLRRREA